VVPYYLHYRIEKKTIVLLTRDEVRARLGRLAGS
jgi:hypothetical protein